LCALSEGASGTEEFVHTIFATIEAVVQHPAVVIDHCAVVADHLLLPLASLVFSLAGNCVPVVTNKYINPLTVSFSECF